MTQQAIIGKQAPELIINKWMQGEPTDLRQLRDKVVLIEVFQVNCPGCFVQALPEVIRVHEQLNNKGLEVIGLATAFEDFDKNTEDNLNLLLTTGQLIGEPLSQLGKAGFLQEGRLDYALPFSVALDKQEKVDINLSSDAVHEFILGHIPEFNELSDDEKAIIIQKARTYLASRTHIPATFNTYQLQGTPSSILIDKKGILREVSFGWNNHLESIISDLVAE